MEEITVETIDVSKTTTKSGITIDEILKAIDLIKKEDNEPNYKISYIHITHFVKIFPKIYQLVKFINGTWYWKDTGIEIKLIYNESILPEGDIIFGKDALMMEKLDICKRCHRKLKDEKSKELGFGKVCYKKYLSRKKVYLFEMEETNETIIK